MLYELREYDVAPGRMDRLNTRFCHDRAGLLAKHDIEVLGLWTDGVGVSNRLTYLVRYEDMAHRERAWSGFANDPERLAEFAATEGDEPLVTRIENRLLQPTDYSPMT